MTTALTLPIQSFYVALGQASAATAVSSLAGVTWDQSTVRMLMPAAQALHVVQPIAGQRVYNRLLSLEPTGQLQQVFADAFEKVQADEVRRVGELIVQSGDPGTTTNFLSHKNIMDAVRKAVRSGMGLDREERLTTQDRIFYDALGLGGHWTRRQLLALTLHICDQGWAGRLRKLNWYYTWLAELVGQGPNRIVGIGPATQPFLEESIGRLGLSLGMPIERIDGGAIAHYAIYRAKLKVGSDDLLALPLDKLPSGLPLTSYEVQQVRERWAESFSKPLRTVRDLSTLNGKMWFALSKSHPNIIPLLWLEINLLGFQGLSTVPHADMLPPRYDWKRRYASWYDIFPSLSGNLQTL